MGGEDVKQLKKDTLLLYCKGFLALYRSKSCQTVGNGEYNTENESSQDSHNQKVSLFVFSNFCCTLGVSKDIYIKLNLKQKRDYNVLTLSFYSMCVYDTLCRQIQEECTLCSQYPQWKYYIIKGICLQWSVQTDGNLAHTWSQFLEVKYCEILTECVMLWFCVDCGEAWTNKWCHLSFLRRLYQWSQTRLFFHTRCLFLTEALKRLSEWNCKYTVWQFTTFTIS